MLEKELQTEIRKELATELVERSKLSESEAAQDNDDADSVTTPSSSPMKKRFVLLHGLHNYSICADIFIQIYLLSL